MTSHTPIAAMAGVSMLGGVLAYTRVGSVPSLVACMGISGLMVVSSMRIRDGMNWGNEAAAVGSLALLGPTLRYDHPVKDVKDLLTSSRAVVTRGNIPMAISALAAGSSAYYLKGVYDDRSRRL